MFRTNHSTTRIHKGFNQTQINHAETIGGNEDTITRLPNEMGNSMGITSGNQHHQITRTRDHRTI